MSDTDAACVAIAFAFAFCVKAKKNTGTSATFFRIVDYFHFFSKIHAERITFLVTSSLFASVKQNCICIFFSDSRYIPWI